MNNEKKTEVLIALIKLCTALALAIKEVVKTIRHKSKRD